MNMEVDEIKDILTYAISNGYIDIVKDFLETNDRSSINEKEVLDAAVEASKNGHTKVIETLIDNGINTSSYGKIFVENLELSEFYKNRLLINEIKDDNLKGLEELLSTGINVLGFNDNAIRYAVKKDNIDMVDILLKYDADKNAALSEAANEGMEKIATHLISTKEEEEFYNHKVLLKKISDFDLKGVEDLIKKGIDVSFYNDEAISLATSLEAFSIMECLLKNGANGEKALISAVLDDNERVVECLVKNGVKGEEALLVAAEEGNLLSVECLINNNVNVSAEDIMLETPIEKAARKGHFDIVEVLYQKLKEDDEIEGTENRKQSVNNAIEIAASFNKENIVKYLYEQKEKNDEALYYAAREGNLKIVEFLIDKADVHVADCGEDDEGQEYEIKDAAIVYAAEFAHLDVVKYLKENGADITANNNLALKRAKDNGCIDVVKYLEEELEKLKEEELEF